MLCPYCVREIRNNAEKCPHDKCEKEIPVLYRKYYPRQGLLRRREPVIMSAVGFGGHGKTVYFASLLHVMGNELTRVWKGFYRQGIDREAVQTVRVNLQMLERGELPESTRQNFPHPNVHRLANIPRNGDKLIVIYDTSGEAFEEDLRVERHAYFVTHARTVLFLISLVDLEEPIAEEIGRLLTVYVQGMARLEAKTEKQHLVVVFTKADVWPEQYMRNYPLVADHLSNNSYVEMEDVKGYMKKLEEVSNLLADFMSNELKAHNFTNMAAEAFKSVAYCAVSSLGQAPDGSRLKDSMAPIRVADPLLWMLKRE